MVGSECRENSHSSWHLLPCSPGWHSPCDYCVFGGRSVDRSWRCSYEPVGIQPAKFLVVPLGTVSSLFNALFSPAAAWCSSFLQHPLRHKGEKYHILRSAFHHPVSLVRCEIQTGKAGRFSQKWPESLVRKETLQQRGQSLLIASSCRQRRHSLTMVLTSQWELLSFQSPVKSWGTRQQAVWWGFFSDQRGPEVMIYLGFRMLWGLYFPLFCLSLFANCAQSLTATPAYHP